MAAATVLHATNGSGATFSFEKRQAAAALLFLPNSGSAATFQVAGVQALHMRHALLRANSN